MQEENEKGKWKYKIISPISSSEWNDYNDTLKIKFTDDIMPYLIELKTNFHPISDYRYHGAEQQIWHYSLQMVFHEL